MTVWTRRRPRAPEVGADRPAVAAVPPAAAAQAAGYARLAGVVGLVFAALFTASIVLVHRAPGLAGPDSDYARFYSTGDHGALVTAGLYIVPFAGIAFLWFLMAVRALQRELPGSPNSAIPRGLQLISGALFVVMVFGGMAAAGAVALLTAFSASPLPSVGVARGLLGVGYGMVFVYAGRMAGMFMITTSTLLKACGVLPRWLAWLGYLAAAAVLVSWTFHPAFVFILPGWVVVVSVVVFAAGARRRATPLAAAGEGTAAVPAPRP